MAIQSKLQLEKFHYGIDIRRGKQLYGMSGKILYLGQWLSREEQPVIIVEMNEIIAEREACFNRELNGHAHIIRTFGYVENPSNLTIYVQEYAVLGDLSNILMDNQIRISSAIFQQIFSQVADAMTYIASRSIVHGDLGCRNILVYKLRPSEPKETLVKITDFGLARWASTVDHSDIIPVRYCAPEILRENLPSSYSEKSDVYSMGVFMWEALSNGEMPYSSIASDDEVKRIKLTDERLIQPTDCDRQFCIIMGKCWAFRPDERVCFQQIREELAEVILVDSSDVHLSMPPDLSIVRPEYKLNVDVQMGECLEGSYGKTYGAQWISKTERSIVLIKLDQQPTASELVFYTELRSHPHIIYTFGFVENALCPFLLLQEGAHHGNLQVLLQTAEFQPGSEVLIAIFSQIIEAMIHVTKHHLVHGDLRCANVLVFQMNNWKAKENLVKLTNFTSAHSNVPSVMKSRRTKLPARYAAPEILRSAGRSNYSELSDVYSMGVLMWEACSNGRMPYESFMLDSEVRKRKLEGEKLCKPWLCHDAVWSIMEDCWYNEPCIRYNFEQMKIRFSNIDLGRSNAFPFEQNVSIQIDEQLHGHFGKVFHEARWIPNKDPSILVIAMDEETARREVPFYLQFSSLLHIVHSFGLIKNNPRLTMLVQERATHGDLQSLLQSKQYQPSHIVLAHVFVQIVEAMLSLTDQHIVHGNLCCEHVLIFRMHASQPMDNLVKLTNFRRARQQSSPLANKSDTIISPRYSAPETFSREEYSQMSDVYSMGVLMWQACSAGNIPYASMEDSDIRRCILGDEKLQRPVKCPDSLWSIMSDCWYKEPSLRYNFRGMHNRLSNMITSYVPCPTEYLQEDLTVHQKAYSSNVVAEPQISVRELQTRANVTAATSSAKVPQAAEPSTPAPSKSILQRLWSFFRGKK